MPTTSNTRPTQPAWDLSAGLAAHLHFARAASLLAEIKPSPAPVAPTTALARVRSAP